MEITAEHYKQLYSEATAQIKALTQLVLENDRLRKDNLHLLKENKALDEQLVELKMKTEPGADRG